MSYWSIVAPPSLGCDHVTVFCPLDVLAVGVTVLGTVATV